MIGVSLLVSLGDGVAAGSTHFDRLNLGAEVYLGRYSDVALVEIELETAGSIRLEVRKDGKVLSRMTADKPHGGWVTFDFLSGMDPPVIRGWSPYAIHIVNTSGGTKVMKEVNVYGGARED